MSEALGAVYSAADSFKRKLIDALRNPGATLEQVVGHANDRARSFNEMNHAAAQEGANFGPETKRLADALAASYNPGGIFIGAESKLWNPKAAFDATKLAAKNVDPREIWARTGTFKGPDGNWRQEIDDSASKFVDAAGIAAKAEALRNRGAEIKALVKPNKSQPDLFPKELTAARRPLKQEAQAIKQELESYYGPETNPLAGNFAKYAYEHKPLYEAYPQLEKVVVRQGAQDRGGVHGSYAPDQLEITELGLRNNPRTTAVHEMQHAVQDIENFGRGGSASMAFQDSYAHEILKALREKVSKPASFEEFQRANKFPEAEAKEAYAQYVKERQASPLIAPNIERELQNTAAREYYKRLAGEAEARAVEKRLDYSPAKRKQVFPLDDYDIDPSTAIVRFFAD